MDTYSVSSKARNSFTLITNYCGEDAELTT